MLAFFEGLEGYSRVWYLTKIRCGNRENDEYFDGTQDLTAPSEAELAKIWARDGDFFPQSVGNSGNRHDPNKRSSGQRESTKRALSGVYFRAKLHNVPG